MVELIQEAKQRGAAIVGIFHDEINRNQVSDRLYHMSTQTISHTNQINAATTTPV